MEFKSTVTQRMMAPQNESAEAISRETGIPEGTLYSWKKTARSKGYAMPAGEQESERWSAQDKFLIVVETAGFSEADLAEYCRSKGLYAEQVQSWRDACMQANGGVVQQLSQLQKELRRKEKENKKLEQELRRKDAALAETAALLVLRKKANAIWGDGEDA
jgi:transposase-like protein